jgi:ankyrin repeat protein
VEELFASGISVHTTDKHGNTCLHIACQNGNKRMVKVCLRWGANINATNKQGQTPLHYCMAYNYQEVSIYLISKGGDDSILNHFGMSCYDGLRPDNKEEAVAALKKHLGEQAVTAVRAFSSSTALLYSLLLVVLCSLPHHKRCGVHRSVCRT